MQAAPVQAAQQPAAAQPGVNVTPELLGRVDALLMS
jgi:hypothetical protein